MRVVFTSQAKEDISVLAQIDQRAYRRLREWLMNPIERLSNQGLSTQLCMDTKLTLFSRALSEVHRLVYAYQNDEMVVLQCRFHF